MSDTRKAARTYHVEHWQIIGRPNGSTFEQYAVIATPADGRPFAFAFGPKEWCESEAERWTREESQ